MEKLPLPQKIVTAASDNNHAKIVIGPCYPGYGTTLGNSLRRVLLSSLPGAAVVAVRITGADHEFSTLAGVKDDVVDILLNIKQLRLRVFSQELVSFNLKVAGEKIVTAADITPNSAVEILNKDLVIANLTDKKAVLEIEFFAEQGRGYVPVENQEDVKHNIGEIAIDAFYTPVRRVGYSVENVRVGQMTNYDKLTLDVETDGSLTPLEAVQQASRILIDHFAFIAGDKTVDIAESAAVDTVPLAPAPIEVNKLSVPERVVKKRGRPRKEV